MPADDIHTQQATTSNSRRREYSGYSAGTKSLLTYLLTPCSGALLEKLTVP